MPKNTNTFHNFVSGAEKKKNVKVKVMSMQHQVLQTTQRETPHFTVISAVH